METLIAIISASIAAIGLLLNFYAIEKQTKFATIKFIADQLDSLDEKGVRKLLLEMGDQEILTFINGDNDTEQLFKQYIYTLNRIAASINHEVFDKKTVFTLWSKKWFKKHWERFLPLIEQEEIKQGMPMYVEFKRLVK